MQWFRSGGAAGRVCGAALVVVIWVAAAAGGGGAAAAADAGAAAPAELAQSLSHYRSAVAQIESETGPYAATLAEPLWGLGRLLQQRGDHTAAASVFERAMHLTRINQGLYSSDQIPLLKAAIEANMAAGRWGQVDNGFARLQWLYQRALAREEPLDYVAGLKKTANWHLAVVNFERAAQRRGRLEKANEINQLMLTAAERQYGDSDPALAPVLYRLALSYYYLALSTVHDWENQQLLAEPLLLRSRSQLARQQEVSDEVLAQANRHLRAGREVMRRIRDIYAAAPQAGAAAAVMADIYLADWELLSAQTKGLVRTRFSGTGAWRHPASHGSVGRALERYRSAEARLLELGFEARQLQQYFARPVILPQSSFSTEFATQPGGDKRPEAEESAADTTRAKEFVSWSSLLKGVSYPGEPLSADAAAQLAHATASFKINARGRATDIEFVARSPAGLGVSRAREEIQAIQFRPPLNAGSTANTAVVMHYRFPNRPAPAR